LVNCLAVAAYTVALGHVVCVFVGGAVTAQAPDDETVWRQLLRYHLDHKNPSVAQQAAAALAE
jgi:hypothetical protein